jgi:hypothetical protein
MNLKEVRYIVDHRYMKNLYGDHTMLNSIIMRSRSFQIFLVLTVFLSSSTSTQAAQGVGWLSKNWHIKAAVLAMGTIAGTILFKNIGDWFFDREMRKHLGPGKLLDAQTRTHIRATLSADEKRKLDNLFAKSFTGKAMVDLLNAGADINALGDGTPRLTLLALWAAADREFTHIFLPLLLQADADINARNSDNSTALILAAQQGSSSGVQLLLQAPRIAVDIKDHFGKTALEHAHYWHHAASAQILEQYNRAQHSLPDAITLSNRLNIHGPFITIAQPAVLMHETVCPYLPPDLVNIIKTYMLESPTDIRTIRAHMKTLSNLTPKMEDTYWGEKFEFLPPELDPAIKDCFDQETKKQSQWLASWPLMGTSPLPALPRTSITPKTL